MPCAPRCGSSNSTASLRPQSRRDPLHLRNLQTLVEIGVDKNTTVAFPAPLMTTIAELGTFLRRETEAAAAQRAAAAPAQAPAVGRSSTTPRERPEDVTSSARAPNPVGAPDRHGSGRRGLSKDQSVTAPAATTRPPNSCTITCWTLLDPARPTQGPQLPRPVGVNGLPSGGGAWAGRDNDWAAAGCGGACPEGWCGVHLSDGCFLGSGAGSGGVDRA